MAQSNLKTHIVATGTGGTTIVLAGAGVLSGMFVSTVTSGVTIRIYDHATSLGASVVVNNFVVPTGLTNFNNMEMFNGVVVNLNGTAELVVQTKYKD